MKPDFLRALDAGRLLGDGAMGTELEARGAAPPYERLNLERPDLVLDVHRAFVAAGAQLLRTNTFLARSAEETRAGVRLAREAAGGKAFVAGALGPGTAQAAALADAGCDLILLETFTDNEQLLAALRRAKATGLPIVAQMAGAPDARIRAEADVVGVNCLAPAETAGIVAGLGGRLSAFPHAGLPGRRMSPAAFAAAAGRLKVSLLGGCCGAGPEHLRALAEAWACS